MSPTTPTDHTPHTSHHTAHNAQNAHNGHIAATAPTPSPLALPAQRAAAVNRRHVMATAAALAAASVLLPRAARAAGGKPSATAVEVWKDPNCGCCKDWVEHMQTNGFQVTVHESGNAAVRTKLGLPQQLGSCHTALVGGYLLEGHVPAADVQRLLRDKPQALGLAVPGMPVGSPGMDGPLYNGRQDPYDVLLVARNGTTTVYNRYPQKAG